MKILNRSHDLAAADALQGGIYCTTTGGACHLFGLVDRLPIQVLTLKLHFEFYGKKFFKPEIIDFGVRVPFKSRSI